MSDENARTLRVGDPVRLRDSDLDLPYMPPEKWNEPTENGRPFKIEVQKPGKGYRHVLTPAEIRDRLAQLPENFTASLEHVL